MDIVEERYVELDELLKSCEQTFANRARANIGTGSEEADRPQKRAKLPLQDDDVGAALVDSVKLLATQAGVDNQQLLLIVNLLDKYRRHMSPIEYRTLMRSMIPRQLKVSVDVVVALLGVFPSMHYLEQKLALQWLLLNMDFIENAEPLINVYSILFHYIDYVSLRRTICQILYRITRLQHVTQYRARKLAQLRYRVGEERTVLMLIELYRYFAPMSIDGTLPLNLKPAVVWKLTPEEDAWRQEIAAAQHLYARTALGRQAALDATETSGAWAVRSLRDAPGLASLGRATRLAADDRIARITVEELRSPEQFVRDLHRLQLPIQLASALHNTYVQQYLSLCGDEVSQHRVTHWLTFVLDAELRRRANHSPKQQRELLHTLAMFAFATDATLPGIREFLASYLKRAGTAALLAADALHSDAIEEALRDVLWLVERLPVEPFATLRSALLAPLTDVFNAGGPAAKVRVLASLRALATRWASSLDSLTAAADDDDDGAASSATAVRALWRHVTRLADLALAAHPTHALIEHHVLLVYERAARLHQQHGCAFVIDPPRALVQRGLVSLNATALSRVCGLIVQLSTEYQAFEQTSNDQTELAALANKISVLDDLVQIVSAAVWNGSLGERNLSYSMLGVAKSSTNELQKSLLNDRLLIVYHPALLALAREYIVANGVGDTQAPADVSNDTLALMTSERLGFLDTLRDLGLTGLHTFLFTFIDVLARNKASSSSSTRNTPSSSSTSLRATRRTSATIQQ